MYILAINAVAGIILSGAYAVHKIHRSRIYTVFHTESKQEFIQQQLAKVQSYVSASMDAGRSVASIKDELLGVGWQEYEIDSIMVNAMLKEQDIFSRFQ